jgi:hypothetical protein
MQPKPERKEVKVGQIWQCNDPRYAADPRRIKIESISGGEAFCENVQTGRKGRIAVARFVPNNTGYFLVEDINGTTASA